MTTNWPPIPDAAIEAAAFALLECMPSDTPTHFFRLTNEGRVAAEVILRVAAPHMLTEAHSAIEHLREAIAFVKELRRDIPDWDWEERSAFDARLRRWEAPSE